MSLKIDVISDVVCPWCFVGKRRLDEALQIWRTRYPDQAPTVHWHPFELNPDMPAEGMDRREYLENKFGGPKRAREVYARVEAAGREVGINFDFSSIELQPNTVEAHRLIAWAGKTGSPDQQAAMVEALFRGYFLDGRDLTQRETLETLAVAAGFDKHAAAEFLKTREGVDQVKLDEESAHQIGVQGVPFFILNGRLAVSGAQPADVLLSAMERALSTETSANA